MAATVAPLLLAGCANMSGLGGVSSFQCKAPDGVPCQSVSGVHANERAGNLPGQRKAAPTGLAPVKAEAARAAPEPTPAVSPGVTPGPTPVGGSAKVRPASLVSANAPLGALRSAPTFIRIWVAPWEDADGDLNDQSYLYLQLDTGRWQIEHTRERLQRGSAVAGERAAR